MEGNHDLSVLSVNGDVLSSAHYVLFLVCLHGFCELFFTHDMAKVIYGDNHKHSFASMFSGTRSKFVHKQQNDLYRHAMSLSYLCLNK